ncbi:Phenazine biosynthesis-like domain-containing protein 1 [Halotydeus destructor]|nr:Phenazine biosynthesis-like domain-containing protein 1 [Halotydeus destructor]
MRRVFTNLNWHKYCQLQTGINRKRLSLATIADNLSLEARQPCKMATPFYLVDAFTVPGKPFSGNQAAVCVLEHDDQISDETKQLLAAEINLSETAFVSKTWLESQNQDGDQTFTLRWFTPASEVDLCGHATLATSAVLFSRMNRPPGMTTTQVKFDTKVKGVLSATINWSSSRIKLDFPVDVPAAITAEDLDFLPQLLAHVFKGNDVNQVESVHYGKGTKKLLIRLHEELSDETLSESTLKNISPDFSGLASLKQNLVKGVIVTAKGSGDVHFYSRYFAPWVGINEDPVTGSAHTVLTPYWCNVYPDVDCLLGHQCSKRGGYLYCKLDIASKRVELEGSAKIVVKDGQLII